jgi:hypothetical protein
MGRRLGRKRLYALEKLGQSVTGTVGRGATGSLCSHTVQRDGQRVITDIVLDIGSSKGFYAPGTYRRVMGHTASANGLTNANAIKSHLGLIDATINGIVDLVEVTVVEALTGSQDVANQKVELQYHSTGDKHFSSSAGTHIASLGNLNQLGTSSATEIDNGVLDGNYLYLARGTATNGSPVNTSTGLGKLSAGKILIRLHGVMVPDSL